MPCLTSGTSVATPQGEMRVEDLKVGDDVITRDNGTQPLVSVSIKTLDAFWLRTHEHLQPIVIEAGVLGNGLPEQPIRVSPNHRLLSLRDRTALAYVDAETLIAAKNLLNPKAGIYKLDAGTVTYVHIACVCHQVVLCNGTWTEIFQPHDKSHHGFGNAQRIELFEIFPDLKTTHPWRQRSTSREMWRRQSARLMAR